MPADIRLLKAQELRADEVSSDRRVGAGLQARRRRGRSDAPLGDRGTLLHAGSAVASGRGTGLVCRTGTMTEIGRIAESLAEEEQVPPLVVRIRRFTRIIAIGILGIIIVLGLVQALRGDDLIDIFFLAVALAVSAIPAGLPVAITVALSIGSNRMAERNVIVRKLPAVEGLGACTLIASDKTGTLTENKLTAKLIRPVEGGDVEVGGAGYAPEGGLHAGRRRSRSRGKTHGSRISVVSGALCNEGRFDVEDGDVRASGDAMDIAFLRARAEIGVFAGGAGREAPRAERHPPSSPSAASR